MKRKSLTKQTLAIFWQHAWRHPVHVVLTLIITPVSTIIFRVIPPLIIANVIRRLSTGDYVSGDFWGSFHTEVLLFAFLVVFGGVFLYRLNTYVTWRLESYVVTDLARTMFNHYIQLDATFHADNFGGSLVSRANKLIGSYIRTADSLAFQFLGMIASFIAAMVLVYPYSPIFVWAFSLFSVLFVFITYHFSKNVREKSAARADAENRNTGTLADAITNVMAIKSFSSWRSEKKRYEKVTDFTRERINDDTDATIQRDLAASIITATLQITALVVAIIAIVDRDANLASVFLILSYTSLLTDMLFNFQASTLRGFNRAMGDAYEATVTLLTEPSVKDPTEPEKLRMKSADIAFNDVTFDHEDVKEEEGLFHNLNLQVHAGEKVGLVGHSGGGKTTVTKLLLRFMDIDGGEIAIGGQSIAAVTQDDLRSQISYVPQEPLLFHRSLSENIGYGKRSASQAEVERTAKMAHAHEFIEKLPQGYDTLVGERGVKLSGGQKQRVAIARAMLKDAPILVLDEATSALDSESEVLIQDALWKLMEGRTAIVIAHRLSTIQKMDRIIVMDDGKIVEEGTHKELIAQKGVYASLWDHQTGGFIEE